MYAVGLAASAERDIRRILQRVLPANLYRRLRDMRARGLVEEVNAPEGTPDDERQRRTFAVTELGRRIAVAEAQRLDALVADARRVLREV